jgi:2'-5' RNA ligase
MRTFLAIALPDEVKANLAAAIQRLAPEAVDVSWCKRDQLHLTLAFLGETAPAILPHVTAAAERLCAARPAFSCRCYGLGFFGNKRNPKVIWAGVDPSGELESLHSDLWSALTKFGFEDREAGFRPHVTLGRCREAARNHALIEAMDADEEVAFGEWEVKRVTLYESRLTPQGALHKNLGHVQLGG